MNRHRMWWLIPWATAMLVGGCSSTNNQAADDQPVNSGLESLSPGESAEDAGPDDGPDVGRMTADFERGLGELGGLMKRPRQAASVAESGPDSDSSGGEVAATPTIKAPEEQDENAADAAVLSEELAPSSEELMRALSGEVAGLLRTLERDDPYALALRLVALRAAGEGPIPGLDALIESLPIDERETVSALAAVLSGLDADPASLADRLEGRAMALSEARPMQIVRTALCSRVEGYGRYTELGGDAFMAGTSMRMIIYTEVAHFDQQPVSSAGDGPGWEVKLSQELQLYHESDGLLAWRRPEEVTVYRTKSRLRDYFVVNQIELPRNLTVGAYRLKVVMRDLSDRSVDERILPIQVVADRTLATGFGG